MDKTLTSNEVLEQSKYTPISYYSKLTDKTCTKVSIESLLQMVQTGKGFKSVIMRLRLESDKVTRDELKKTLPAVTVSALFKNGRKTENLLLHSGFIHLDFDNVKDIETSLQRLRTDRYTFAVFLSPSGTGIKLIVKIPPNSDTHVTYFNELEKYYIQNFQLTADKQCKDVNRLLFLSWDEEIYVNNDSTVWGIINETDAIQFIHALEKVQSKAGFIEGNRNTFIYKLACESYNNNVSISYAISEINKRFSSEDFNSNEIDKTVKSAYSGKGKSIEAKKNPTTSYSLLQQAENYLENKYIIRLNEVSSKIEIKAKDTNEIFKELNEANVFRELQHNNIPLVLQKITCLLQSDFVPTYNPFIDYFEGLPEWIKETDKDFIDELCNYIPVRDTDRFKLHFKKMLLRCIACALQRDFFNKQVFVLIGETQNTGKSTFLRWLCPPALSDYITEYVNTDKDGLIVLATNFFINMDELATLSKAEINSLKSFISKDKINVRLPFAKRTSVHPRRANFIGSTNNDEFLTDDTGSVRWLCFEIIDTINFKYKDDINIDDIWRQAYALYKKGTPYQLTVDEIRDMEASNSRFLIQSMEAQLINKYYEPASKEDGKFVDASEVYKYIVFREPYFKSNIRSMGKAMNTLGFKKVSRYYAERRFSLKGYYVREILEDPIFNNSITRTYQPSYQISIPIE